MLGYDLHVNVCLTPYLKITVKILGILCTVRLCMVKVYTVKLGTIRVHRVRFSTIGVYTVNFFNIRVYTIVRFGPARDYTEDFVQCEFIL